MAMYRLTESQYTATVDRIAKINERATKRGLTGRITVTGTPVEVRELDPLTGLDRVSQMMDVELSGEAPRFDGWTFLATLEWDGNAGLIVRTAPGIDTIDRSQLRDEWCDHCRTARHRTMTYLVRHDDGRQAQLGSTCLKDYLGWVGSIAWLDVAEVSEEIEAGGFGGYGDPPSFGTEYVLAIAWALIKLDGYRPASSFGATTKGSVMDVLQPPRGMSSAERASLARIHALASEATQRAAECRAWVLSDDFSGDSEYVRNLKAIAASDYVSWRSIGFLVSAPQAWAKHLERTLVREADKRVSSYVGNVKDRITVAVTVAAVRFIPSTFGTTVLYTMRDDDGNVYKWFSSSGALGDETGERFTIKATVKGHEEYQGVRQTVLTRAKTVQ